MFLEDPSGHDVECGLVRKEKQKEILGGVAENQLGYGSICQIRQSVSMVMRGLGEVWREISQLNCCNLVGWLWRAWKELRPG